MQATPLHGVTVLPEFFQVEGVDAVLDRLAAAGVNAVTTSPYVMEEADEKTGTREPPDDAGAGNVRLLDRPLWGKKSLFVRTAPSFMPNRAIYQGLRYQPAALTELTRREGGVIQRVIRACQSRHIRIYLQVQAAIPPGYRVQFGGPTPEDQPRLPDGSIPARRVSKNGSLASPAIRDYQHALILDLVRQYPEIDGLRFDWPEYPPYFLSDVFLDFSSHAEAAAKRMGFDFTAMKNAARGLWNDLHKLTDDDLSDAGVERLLARRPELANWLRFKARLVEELLAGFRAAMNEAGAPKMAMMPNAFPPPWSKVSGMDFALAAKHSDAIAVKHYTMHWSMMLRFYADDLRQWNPKLSPKLLGPALVKLLDMVDGGSSPSADDFHYPGPDEPHLVGSEALQRKIQQARQEAGATPILPLAHGYGPIADFTRRLTAAAQSSPHGFWINRYGYLSGEKIRVIGQIVKSL